MKRFVTVFALVLIAQTLFAQSPELKFSESTHDFGKIDEAGGKVSHVFEFTNTGSSPLVIENVQASCGCTTPSWTRTPVQPGQKGSVTAEYNPYMRPGAFMKSLTISSNASTPKTVIYIKGEVVKDMPKPVVFSATYVYNGKNIEERNTGFAEFATSVASLMRKKNGSVEVIIESSASKVPTKKYKDNSQLATERAKSAKDQLMAAIKAEGLDVNNLKFNEPAILVQGPDYKKDYEKNKAEYEKYQYVKFVVK